MAAITGQQYIERIDGLDANIWFDGKRVVGKISEHPAFKGVMKTQAALYEMQHNAALKDVLTFQSPTTGDRVGLSFLQPVTKEELIRKRLMVQKWATLNNGLMGRSPDYMNTVLMALASSADLLKNEENCFPEHLLAYFEYARENDISLTHTFIEPQVNRRSFHVENEDEIIAARVVDRKSAGLVIKGARLLATQGGTTDELLVLSSAAGLDEAKGFGFAIPSNTKGLKFICRESFVGGDSAFDHPLSSRFEEMDCVVVFDDVVVPWERVFYYDNVDVANSIMSASSFKAFTMHQVQSRQIVKIEFFLGVVQSIVGSINIGEHQHVQQKVAEVIIALETMKALLFKAEAEARLDEFGYMRPDQMTLQIASNITPQIFPRFAEIIQQLGASGLMAIPSEKTYQSEVRDDMNHYLQSFLDEGEDRVRKFRLAWDLSMSSFGSRQTLYERFFFGDPVRLACSLYQNYDKGSYVKMVERFLSKD
ncbi:MAG: 4-hydroxyphenylacetate 3-monooxygenase, oxygenase component [Lysinibacillus sp.]